MHIKFIKLWASSGGTRYPNEVLEVEEKRGAELIKNGDAVLASEDEVKGANPKAKPQVAPHAVQPIAPESVPVSIDMPQDVKPSKK